MEGQSFNLANLILTPPARHGPVRTVPLLFYGTPEQIQNHRGDSSEPQGKTQRGPQELTHMARSLIG